MKKFFLRSTILTLLTITLQLFYGCGTTPVKKVAAPMIDMVCDQKADEALKNRRYEKSIILHEFYLKEHPDNGLAMYHMGFSYGQLGDHENEVKCYEKAISLGFYGSSIFFNLGMVYGEMGKVDDSMRVLKKAIEIDPKNADNHLGLAFAYKRVGSSELAEKEFKRAIKLEPDNIDAIYFLGVHYVGIGQIDEAQKQLEKLIRIDPDNDMTLRLKIMLKDKK